MKPTIDSIRAILLLVAVLMIPGLPTASAQDVDQANSSPTSAGSSGVVTTVLEVTDKDRPGEFNKMFGLPPQSQLRKTLKPLSKIDIDVDLDYDGSIDNDVSSGQGPREYIAPGFQLGEGELSKMVIRFKTYEADFPGDLFVTLTVEGINRLATSGKYETEKEELDSIGHIRVWESPKKKTLLLDSADTEKRSVVWKYDKKNNLTDDPSSVERRNGAFGNDLRTGLPGEIPRIVYIEGVEKSKKFEGDLRLMIFASHSLEEGEDRLPSATYRTAYDHILFTIREEPIRKALINNNAEGVWPNFKENEDSANSE